MCLCVFVYAYIHIYTKCGCKKLTCMVRQGQVHERSITSAEEMA